MFLHSDTSRRYDPSNYDEDMCLKPPLLLWFAVLYLSRGILLPLIVGLGHFAGINSDAMTFLRGYWSVVDLLPSLIAAPVLFAICRRSVTASNATRWIWRRGQILLTLSAAADVLVVLVPYLWHRDSDDPLILSLIACGADLYFLVYTLSARRVRDTFRDFPAPLPHP